MEKIGIITLNGYFNFGNRLQNYALQEVLKTFEYDVETIRINNTKNKKTKEVNQKKKININMIIKKLKHELFLKKRIKMRSERFKQFSEEHINETNYQITEFDLNEEELLTFSFFVTGSDQVWNPYFMKGSPLYFLTFAPKEKRIAYAPSFGVSEIPEEFERNYMKWLNEMKSLSVREEAGAKIIKKYTGRDAQVVADPTLLLTKEQWLTLSEPAKNKPKQKYLLTYYLGQLPQETKDFINIYSKKYDLKIVNLVNHKDKEYYLTDPAEFLDYINSASLFVTDSFHGAVFSIIFETPFVVTNRAGSLPSMNSRIETLLSTYQLENRHINNIDGNALEANFDHVIPILNKERKIAMEYLQKELG